MEPFETLVRDHAAQVWRVCRALVGPNDVDDAWQETFLAALSAYPTARPTRPRAWLLGIAHHKCVDLLRRRYRDPLPIVSDVEGLAAPGRSREAASGAVDDGDVWRVVAQLPPKQRQVIAYRYLGGLTYAEISAVVGGSAAAARRAGSDGVARLRELLKEE